MGINLVNATQVDSVAARGFHAVMKGIDAAMLTEVVIHLVWWESVFRQGLGARDEFKDFGRVIGAGHQRVLPATY
jgi:hypothetical protein